jgi:CBS-domain-containing membrane protein
MEFVGLEPYAGFLERKRRRTAPAKSEAELAGDLMSSPAIVISPAESVTTAAQLMDAKRIKRIRVVDQYGRLVGIVSRRDLLRVYLRGDDAIRSEVVEEVLKRTLWIEPGVVTVASTVVWSACRAPWTGESTIALVARLIEGVAGVVDVANHLTYHHDDTTDPDRRCIVFG